VLSKDFRDAGKTAAVAVIIGAIGWWFYVNEYYVAFILLSLGVAVFLLTLFFKYRVKHFYRIMVASLIGVLTASLALPVLSFVGVLGERFAFSAMFNSVGALVVASLCVLCGVLAAVDYLLKRLEIQGKKGLEESENPVPLVTLPRQEDVSKPPQIFNPQKKEIINYGRIETDSSEAMRCHQDQSAEDNDRSQASTKKVSVNHEQGQQETIESHLFKLGFDAKRECPLKREEYNTKVDVLLNYVKNILCRSQQICILGGTAISLPSKMMHGRLYLYHETWVEHGTKIEDYSRRGRYKAIRLLCHSHDELLADVKLNEGTYKEFFGWCEKTHFDIRLLRKAEDYYQYLKDNGIDLFDFMVFGYEKSKRRGRDALGQIGAEFVFGSTNEITESVINTKLIIDREALAKYEKTLEALCTEESSIEVASLEDLEKYLHNPY